MKTLENEQERLYIKQESLESEQERLKKTVQERLARVLQWYRKKRYFFYYSSPGFAFQF